MSLSRRTFVASVAAAPLATGDGSLLASLRRFAPDPERLEPWIEVDPRALRANAAVLSRLARGRPLTAVIKNNGYGLGLVEVARVLDAAPEVSGFGVVKVQEAVALRDAGIRKPVLLLALFTDAEGMELVRRDITLSLCVPDAAARVARAVFGANRSAKGQYYIDTGMSRMGLPYHRAVPVLRELARLPRVEVVGTLTELAEERDFDSEQVRRCAPASRSSAAIPPTTAGKKASPR
ncbi:MAG: alanine racemase [Gemmatimonadaceae bacterium]